MKTSQRKDGKDGGSRRTKDGNGAANVTERARAISVPVE